MDEAAAKRAFELVRAHTRVPTSATGAAGLAAALAARPTRGAAAIVLSGIDRGAARQRSVRSRRWPNSFPNPMFSMVSSDISGRQGGRLSLADSRARLQARTPISNSRRAPRRAGACPFGRFQKCAKRAGERTFCRFRSPRSPCISFHFLPRFERFQRVARTGAKKKISVSPCPAGGLSNRRGSASKRPPTRVSSQRWQFVRRAASRRPGVRDAHPFDSARPERGRAVRRAIGLCCKTWRLDHDHQRKPSTGSSVCTWFVL